MNILEKKDTENYIVAKSNKLIQQSKISLTLYEQRIINYMISKILADDTEFKFIEIDYTDFCRLCNLKETNLTYTKRVIKTLADKSWYFGKILIRWIGEAEVDSESILLKFHPKMEQFLLQLKQTGNYTQTELLHYLQFTSRYSPILYDYFKSYINLTFDKKNKSFEIVLKLTEIREKLLLENKYPLFKDFRVYVIEPSITEINKTTDLHVECEYIKKSRKVDSIKFTISNKDTVEYLKEYEKRRKTINEPKKKK